MLLYKNIILICLFFIFSCSIIGNYDKKITDQFYISNINEVYGIILKHKINSVFQNKDYNSAKYIVNTSLSLSDSLYLVSISGYATKGLITINFSYSITEKDTNKVLAKYNGSLKENYRIEASGLATKASKDRSIEYLINSISNIIITRLNFFIKNNYENISSQSN
jgi:hypothetical protein